MFGGLGDALQVNMMVLHPGSNLTRRDHCFWRQNLSTIDIHNTLVICWATTASNNAQPSRFQANHFVPAFMTNRVALQYLLQRPWLPKDYSRTSRDKAYEALITLSPQDLYQAYMLMLQPDVIIIDNPTVIMPSTHDSINKVRACNALLSYILNHPAKQNRKNFRKRRSSA